MTTNPDEEQQEDAHRQDASHMHAEQQQEMIYSKRVGKYMIGYELGKGTFGQVRLATHTLSQQKVAVKILPKNKIKCSKDYERISREIMILKQLNNPNIVRLLEVIDTPRNIYIVMEFVQGGELLQYIAKKHHLMEDEACHFFRQMVTAVHYCHQRKICHRDLKLENILLDTDNRIKIIDFGLSNILSQDNMLKTACGSPSYAPPEMLDHRDYCGPMVDVWQLGIILYTMVCGFFPFSGKMGQQLYQKISSGVYKIPPFISAQLADLISRILVVNPAQRIDIDGITQHPWFIEACASPVPPLQSISVSPLIDFRVVYKMVQLVHEWDAAKIIAALSENRHNHMTVTYYLLSEKRARQDGGCVLKYDEQVHYASKLGLVLNRDWTVQCSDGHGGLAQQDDVCEEAEKR